MSSISFLKYLDVNKLDVLKYFLEKKHLNTNKIFTNNNINKSLTYFFIFLRKNQQNSNQILLIIISTFRIRM